MSLESPARKQRQRRVRRTTDRLAFTVDEFVDLHSISRTFLYGLWRKGKGPRFKLVDGKRLITTEAAADWRGEGEQTPATYSRSRGKRGGNLRRGGEEAA